MRGACWWSSAGADCARSPRAQSSSSSALAARRRAARCRAEDARDRRYATTGPPPAGSVACCALVCCCKEPHVSPCSGVSSLVTHTLRLTTKHFHAHEKKYHARARGWYAASASVVGSSRPTRRGLGVLLRLLLARCRFRRPHQLRRHGLGLAQLADDVTLGLQHVGGMHAEDRAGEPEPAARRAGAQGCERQ